MKLKGKIKSIDLDFITHKPKITLEVNSQYDLLTEELNDLQELELINIELKKAVKQRSLNANAYAWTLLGKIAQELNSSKEEIYREFIKNRGVYRVITIDEKAANTFKKVWNEKGLGWQIETSESNVEGFIDVIAYYGTSSYNTKQMAYFIDYVVEEAKNLGIEVLPHEEIEALKNSWG